MTKVSEHLHAFHRAAHGHHAEMVAAHQTALEKAAAMEPGGGPHSTFLKTSIASHEKMAAHHLAQMAECQKAVESDLNKTMPLPAGLSIVAPDRPGIRAVPRTGSPAFQRATVSN